MRTLRIYACLLVGSLPAAAAPLLAAAEHADLRLKRVVAFSSGVAYFQYAGRVEGDQSTTLGFEPRDVNDVLKSLVLLDLDGGQASAVTYDNREPIARSLAALGVDLTENVGMAALLRQLRGHEVEVDGKVLLSGRIVSVEKRRVAVGEQAIERDFLLLSTAQGLKAVEIDALDGLRLLDEKLDADFQRALELLATRSSSQSKEVTIRFSGQGERRVSVGLIQEFPVWKTSYRLVLDHDGEPLLQGWAIVENTTNAPWRGVELALVSGRPISFQMDLYEPLYVQRPTVVAEQFAGLAPRVHQQSGFDDLFGEADPFGGFDSGEVGQRQMERTRRARELGTGGAFGGGGGGFGGGGGDFGGYSGHGQAGEQALQEQRPLSEAMAASQLAAGAGEEVGELFRYKIDAPVTLEPEHSTMLPIVNSKVKGRKLAIYNPAVHEKHPLSGFRLTNSTDLHLAQGPVTVFDDGEYAGDARLGGVPAGEERLLSYALDLQTEVAVKPVRESNQLVEAKTLGRTLVLKFRRLRGDEYAVKNSHDQPKHVLIERHINPEWRLVSPDKPHDTARDWRRFELSVEPGATRVLRVVEEHFEVTNQAIDSLNERRLAMLLEIPGLPGEVKATLNEHAQRQLAIDEAESELAGVIKRLTAIADEHDRIRKNMQNLDRTSDLYRRYEEKLGRQETEIESLQKQVPAMKAKLAELKQQGAQSPRATDQE